MIIWVIPYWTRFLRGFVILNLSKFCDLNDNYYPVNIINQFLNLVWSLSLSLDKIPSDTCNTQIQQKVWKYPLSPKKPLTLGKGCIGHIVINCLKIFKWDGSTECPKEEENQWRKKNKLEEWPEMWPGIISCHNHQVLLLNYFSDMYKAFCHYFFFF